MGRHVDGLSLRELVSTLNRIGDTRTVKYKLGLHGMIETAVYDQSGAA
jgi:hypothetical protein